DLGVAGERASTQQESSHGVTDVGEISGLVPISPYWEGIEPCQTLGDQSDHGVVLLLPFTVDREQTAADAAHRVLMIEGAKEQLAGQLGPPVLTVGKHLLGPLEASLVLVQEQPLPIVSLQISRVHTGRAGKDDLLHASTRSPGEDVPV